jgi:FAD:protein FMN transferase
MAGVPFHSTTFAMNTRLSFVLPGVSHAVGASLARHISAYVDEQEWLLSRFKSGPLGLVNRAATDGPVRVPEALWNVLMTCRKHSALTNGLFDITTSKSRLNRLKKIRGMDRVEFNEAKMSVRFQATGMGFDLGAVGKGIALRGIMDWLRSEGVDHAFVSFGESSVGVLGEHPAGGAWPVSLFDAREAGFNLVDETLSVSGQDETQPHIIDPRSGDWVRGNRQLAVAGACPIETEVLSTALLIATPQDRGQILDRYRPVRAVEVSRTEGKGGPKARVMWRA